VFATVVFLLHRREKLRGSAFSEQLLMMLQGKTVSGKLLEEEYRPELRQ
jgi:hypothetical protein